MLEDEQEILGGISLHNKSYLNVSMMSHGGANGVKTHRFNKQDFEDDKHISKLKLQNSLLTEKLKAINY